jgi:molecular chaperone GrpE
MQVKEPKVSKKEENKKIEELKAQLVRALADYDNLKKRVETEKAIWFKVSSARVIGKLLPIMDMIIDAQKHINDSGLAIVLGEFKKAIMDEGFEELAIEPGVTEFDSENMEALEVIEKPENEMNNKVAEVVQSGWKAKRGEMEDEFIIRPAKVKVYKKSEDGSAEN